jgi:hypothetical protein
MGSKSQRKKERERRKQQKKKLKARKQLQQKRREIQFASAGVARHQQRLLQQTPKAWAGETPEDVAVFDDSVLGSLPPDLAGQVSAVREALEDALESRGDDALKRTSAIPRSSPLSQWRLLLRGLVSWLADDTQSAGEAWKRLDPERRPGRIAAAMMLALRSDLEQASQAQRSATTPDESQDSWWSRCDDQLLYHAKLLRRTRFDRPALRTAQTGLSMPEESKQLRLGPKKIQWLRRFIAEHGATEPELTAALSQAALGRAFAQNYSDLFDDATRSFPGPRHDRRNLLLIFFYFVQFGKDPGARTKAQRALDEYLNRDLPQNEELSEPLRSAIASQIHLNEATALMRPSQGGLMDMMFGPPEDPKAIRKHLSAAVKAYPAHRAAYRAHVEWIESKLDNDRLTKPMRKPWEEELALVMQAWSRALPEDAEPRLWLFDYLLENERSEEAGPHVEWLAASRQEDPRVRAAPWKWQLLEAMRLCRRKAWLAEVQERLEQAEKLWPVWLSQQWLPYLKAAWTCRSGQAEPFEQQRQQICQQSGLARDSLADACMMLGAAQRMQIPAAELKQFRGPVDQAVNNLGRLPLDELLSVSSFFWDLHRTQLLYPAYRMHGGKIGKELLARLSHAPQRVLDGMNDERIQAAVLWFSDHRFWGDGYELRLPPWYASPAIQRHPMFAAARVNAFLKLRYQWQAEEYRQLGPLLREAAQSQRDAYYRHWFGLLAQELDDVLATASSRFGGLNFDFFGDVFGSYDGDEDDEFDDEDDGFDFDLGFDPTCNCPDCQAARRAYRAKR